MKQQRKAQQNDVMNSPAVAPGEYRQVPVNSNPWSPDRVKEQLALLQKNPGTILFVDVSMESVDSASQNLYELLWRKVRHADGAVNMPTEIPPGVRDQARIAASPESLKTASSWQGQGEWVDIGGGIKVRSRIRPHAIHVTEDTDIAVTNSNTSNVSGTVGASTESVQAVSAEVGGKVPVTGGEANGKIGGSVSEKEGTSSSATTGGSSTMGYTLPEKHYSADINLEQEMEAVWSGGFEAVSNTYRAGASGDQSLKGLIQ